MYIKLNMRVIMNDDLGGILKETLVVINAYSDRYCLTEVAREFIVRQKRDTLTLTSTD
jgi:hypothetical protein